MAGGGSILLNLWARLAWGTAGILLLALLLTMTASLLVSYFTLPTEKRPYYNWESEITRKLILLVMVGLSMILDVVLYVGAETMPTRIPILDQGYLFLTLTSLLWLIMAEANRIITAVGDSNGSDVPPTLSFLVGHVQWVIRNLRKIDRRRYKTLARHEGEPPRRWMDELTDTEVADIVTWLETRGPKTPEEE